MASSFISQMAITSRLTTVFWWHSGMANGFISSYISCSTSWDEIWIFRGPLQIIKGEATTTSPSPISITVNWWLFAKSARDSERCLCNGLQSASVAGRTSGTSHLGNLLTAPHHLTDLYQQFGSMPV